MKIKVNATELHDADVEQVSLVKNGANRLPFRILKTEEAAEAVEATQGLAATIAEAFHKKEQPQISAVVMRKGWPHGDAFLEKADIDISNFIEVDDLLIYKQEGFDEQAALFALNEDLGVAVSGMAKEFRPSIGTDFNENLRSQGFFPSLSDAHGALMDSVWASLEKAGTVDQATSDVDKAVGAFSKYVKGLVKNLPQTVFKMDALLRGDFGGSTVGDTDIEKSNPEDSKMDKLTEAVAGDLDGLLDEPVAKTEEAAPVEKAEEKVTAEADAKTEEAVEKTDEAPAVEAKDEATEEAVEKTAETDQAIIDELGDKDKEGEQDPLKLIAAALQTMTSEIVGLKKTVESQGEKLDAVEKVAKSADEQAAEAVEKADNSVVMTLNDIDESLSGMTRRRNVAKADVTASDDIWAGVMPVFDSLNGGE